MRLFLDAAARNPAHTALIEGSRRTSYAELAALGARSAERLSRAGIGKGDRVVVLVPMSTDLYGWIIGLLLLDATVMFVEPWMPLALLSDCLARAQPKALLASPLGAVLAQKSPAFRALSPKLVTRAAWLFAIAGWRAVPDAAPPATPRSPSAGGDDDAVLTFTTGSSGTPKSVVRTHDLLETQHHILSRSLSLTSDDVCLHVFANFILNNLALGAASVIPPIRASEPTRFSAPRIAATIAREKVTSIVCPPASLERIVAHCEATGARLGTVRSLGTGGGPVPGALLARTAAVFPSCDPEVLYGSSEVEPVSHIRWSELKSVSLDGGGACVGRPVPEIAVRLGESGEVVVSGPHVSRRYFDDPAAMAATKITDPDGTLWHRMGDVARLDGEGRLWLTGRLHTLIDTPAGRVAPLPLEQIAERMPFVVAAAVAAVDGRALLAVEPHDWDDARFPAWRAELLAALPAIADARFVPAIPRDARHRSKIDYARLRALLAGADGGDGAARDRARDPRAFPSRALAYAGERFPLVPSALLSTLLALGAFRVAGAALGPRTALAAAIVFCFLFALRLGDEQKDAAKDAAFHPERPVPRGLVTLHELARLEIAMWLASGLFAAALGARPLVAWIALAIYGGLMRVEFFAGKFLERRPLSYAFTHQPVMLLLVSVLHLAAGAPNLFAGKLLLHQALCLCAMFGWEISRKLSAPEDEQRHDPTYGRVHGPVIAGLLAASLLAGAGAALAALTGPAWAFAAALALPALVFAARPSSGAANVARAAGSLALVILHGALVWRTP